MDKFVPLVVLYKVLELRYCGIVLALITAEQIVGCC